MDSVSIIIPTYNRSKLLIRSLESILSQTHLDTGNSRLNDLNKSYEVLIIDDGSTDDTELRLNSYISQHPQQAFIESKVQYIKTENHGVSHARNVGINKSNFDWLCFLDSDDEWQPEKLEQQFEFSRNNPQIKIIHCNEIWLRNNKELKQLTKHKKWGGRVFSACLPLCNIGPSTTLIHRDIFNDVGLFNEDYPVCEDYELWLRITAKYEVGLVETPLMIKHAGHNDQLSQKLKAMDEFRVSALINMRKSKDISLFEKYLLEEHIIDKTNVLIKGYQKYNNENKHLKFTALNNEALIKKEEFLNQIILEY